jgi:hypothetical protein
MARRPVMNQSKKLELSKETLRCLDDQDLTDIVGGGDGGDKGRGGGGNNQSFVLGVVGCISNNCFNSNGGGNGLIGVCL